MSQPFHLVTACLPTVCDGQFQCPRKKDARGHEEQKEETKEGMKVQREEGTKGKWE